MMSRTSAFVDELSKFRLKNVFNPYSDRCHQHDRPDAPAIRRENLRLVLEASLTKGLDSVWVGRDLGYRGGRRTGIALTDEPHLPELATRLGNIALRRATMTAPTAERTAHEIWKVLQCLPTPPFLWNVFPFHPYEPDDPMSNRSHTAKEAKQCEEIVATLLEWLRPRNIVALGAAAHHAMKRLGHECICVRHPSYGGHNEFNEGVRRAYGLDAPEVAPRML